MTKTVQKENRDAVEGIGSAGDASDEPILALQPETLPERKPLREVISAAALKLARTRDATQAMKEHEAATQEMHAKTVRLRAERLAREAQAASAAKLPAAKKKK